MSRLPLICSRHSAASLAQPTPCRAVPDVMNLLSRCRTAALRCCVGEFGSRARICSPVVHTARHVYARAMQTEGDVEISSAQAEELLAAGGPTETSWVTLHRSCNVAAPGSQALARSRARFHWFDDAIDLIVPISCR